LWSQGIVAAILLATIVALILNRRKPLLATNGSA
jgi:hypothetical protein